MDVEKTIGFLLEQQALNLEAHARQQQMMGQLITIVGQVAEAQRRTEQRVQQMAEAHQALAEAHQALAEAQQRTEHNLNAVIKIVDELIRRDGRRRRN